MRPRRPEGEPSDDLFRARLSNQLDDKHPLIRLAGLIEWESFEAEFGALYHETLGRPGKPTRLMVGLTYLKHCYNLSDEQVCERWPENPYWQFFCGFDYLLHRLPVDPSSLTRWRERIGASGMERLLAATIDAALAAGVTKPASLTRVTIDTTVQPKAIAFPTDSRLYNRGREILVRLAAKYGIRLRQSYHRLGKRALRLANRYAHARQMRRAQREIKRLKTFLGRVARDMAVSSPRVPNLPRTLPSRWRAWSGCSRNRRPIMPSSMRCTHRRSNVWPRACPCESGGKAHKRYEFGVKVSVATTNREGLVLGMLALPGNPYDGHTLASALSQVERLTGSAVERGYVDRGYRGHGLDHQRVFISGQRRGVTATIRRELRRRSAISR
jgi:transposase, IS5 family